MINPHYFISERILDNEIAELRQRVNALEKEYCFNLRKKDTRDTLNISNTPVIVGLIQSPDKQSKICTICPPDSSLELSMLAPRTNSKAITLSYSADSLLIELDGNRYEIRSQFRIDDFL